MKCNIKRDIRGPLLAENRVLSDCKEELCLFFDETREKCKFRELTDEGKLLLLADEISKIKQVVKKQTKIKEVLKDV